MKTLVVLEHRDGALTRASAGVLSHVASLGEPTAALVVGSGVEQLASAAANFGATQVYVADDARLAPALPQPRVDVVAALVRREGFAAVVFAQSVLASDLAAGLAVRLDAGLNWDLVELELVAGRLVGRRLALEDSVWVEVGWSSEVAIALMRPGVHDPLAREGRPELRTCVVEIDERSLRTQLTSSSPEQSEGPSIEDAEVIVAGGRGLGGAAGVAAAGELADALGAALGATRASVDAGWYPSAVLVGQTGKTVAPKLYIALGISGAIQHRVGMRGSGTIVAINTDPAAPIFALADLGVVGDLHTIVPHLAQLVREARGGVISSTDNARVKEVVALRSGRERRRSGLFLAEGPREVSRAAAAGLRIVETFVAPSLLEWPEGQAVSERVLSKMAYRTKPEGVIAIVEAPRWTLPVSGGLYLVAVGVEKPGNLGAIARSAEAAGAEGLLVAEASADPFNPNAIRASTGAVFTLPIVEVTLEDVRALGVALIAAVVGAATPYSDADLSGPVAIAVGAEDRGLPLPWREAADISVAIPLRHGGSTESLNTAVAAAILLFEAVRQRG